VIPYNNPLYRDNRPAVGIPDAQVLPIDKNYAFHPAMAPLKKVWDEGKLAILHGTGYTNSRARTSVHGHLAYLRADKVGTEAGWRVAREYDPNKENVITVVSFGRACSGRWRCQAFPWRAWLAHWKSMASCRASRSGATPEGAGSVRAHVRAGGG